MAEPPGEVGERAADVGRPVGVEVLRLEPGHGLGELRRRGREGQAVRQVEPAVAQGEELRLEEVGAVQRAQHQHPAAEGLLEPQLPPRREEGRQARSARC